MLSRSERSRSKLPDNRSNGPIHPNQAPPHLLTCSWVCVRGRLWGVFVCGYVTADSGGVSHAPGRVALVIPHTLQIKGAPLAAGGWGGAIPHTHCSYLRFRLFKRPSPTAISLGPSGPGRLGEHHPRRVPVAPPFHELGVKSAGHVLELACAVSLQGVERVAVVGLRL